MTAFTDDVTTFPKFDFVRDLPHWVGCAVKPHQDSNGPCLVVSLYIKQIYANPGEFYHTDFYLRPSDDPDDFGDMWNRYIAPCLNNLEGVRNKRQ